MKHLRRVFPGAALAALATLALSACGDDARIDSCGPGTMLVGDTCELIDGGTGGNGGQGSDAGDGGQATGGAGGHTDRPEPVELDGVALTALSITADTPALRPLWPVTVDARFRIVAPPFDSVAGVLLRTQDGAKSCLVGVLDVAHRTPDGGARAAEAQVSMTTTLPAECAALAGLPDVHAAVVFDLFGGSTLHGDTPLGDAVTDSPAPLLGAALPFDRCAPTPAQGATCDATYTVEPSPGPSIALTDLTVSNPVVVIEYPEGERPAIPADVLRRNLTPPGKDPATLYPADAPAVTVPILPATLPLGVRLSVEGVEKMDAGTLGLAARIRPLPGAVRTAALPAPAQGWQPLALIVRDPADPAAANATVPELMLPATPAGEGTAVELIADADASLRSRIALGGAWSGVSAFEVAVCVRSRVPEADAGPQKTPDNCAAVTIDVLHSVRSGRDQGAFDVGGARKDGEGAVNVVAEYWDRTAGGGDFQVSASAAYRLGVTLGGPNIEVIDRNLGAYGSARGGYLGARAWATTRVYGRTFELAGAGMYVVDFDGDGDTVLGRLAIFGRDFLPPVGVPVPDGQLTLETVLRLVRAATGSQRITTELTAAEYLLGRDFQVLGKGIRVSINAVVATGLHEGETRLFKEALNEPRQRGCDTFPGGTGLPSGRQSECIVRIPGQYAPMEAFAACIGLGGRPVVPGADDMEIARQVVGQSWAWVRHVWGAEFAPSSTRDILEPGMTRTDPNNWNSFSGDQYLWVDGRVFPQPFRGEPAWWMRDALQSADAENYGFAFFSAEGMRPAPDAGRFDALCVVPTSAVPATGTSIGFDFVPFVRAGLEANASFDAVIISAGIQGSLTLAEITLPYTFSFNWLFEQTGKVHGFIAERLALGVRFLSGEIKIWGKLLWKRGDFTIASWNGIYENYPLFERVRNAWERDCPGCVPAPPADPCAIGPCTHGACSVAGAGYRCDCEIGWRGFQCDVAVDFCAGVVCENGGACRVEGNDFRCDCAAGWTGRFCEINIDECAPAPCQNGGGCIDGIADYTCACTPGWQGKNCEQDIDECLPRPCQNGAACRNLQADYRCECLFGYEGRNCEVDIDECAPRPCQNGQCLDLVNDFRCVCPAGYDGRRCENNIDECAARPCRNGGTCTDQLGGFTCQCRPGFEGADCGTNIDECAGNPCQNGGVCHDRANRYVCQCPAGFSGTTCQNLDASDDCAGQRCGRAGVCVDTGEAATCDCAAGYVAHGGSCYKYTEAGTTWPLANQACRADGGQLVSIESATEQSFVDGEWSSYHWTGLNDRAAEGTVVWAGGEPLVYRPADAEGFEDLGADTDCGVFGPEGDWFSDPCEVSEFDPNMPMSMSSVCEYRPCENCRRGDLLEITPPAVDFGTVEWRAAQRRQTRDFTVTNRGARATGALELLTRTFPVAQSAMSISSNNCSGNTLDPGETCTIQVRFDSAVSTGSQTLNFGVSGAPGGRAYAKAQGNVNTCRGGDVVVYGIEAGVQVPTGDLGGRAGADALCVRMMPNIPALQAKPVVVALLSVNADDEIRDLPDTAALPTGRAFVTPGGRRLARNLADLLDGRLDNALCGPNGEGAGLPNNCVQAWTGSNDDGTVTADTCNGFTSGDVGLLGTQGDQGATSAWLRRANPATRPCELPNALYCLAYDPVDVCQSDAFVRIEPATFQMGSPDNEPARNADETRHEVSVTRPFLIQRREVTQGDWSQLMPFNPSLTQDVQTPIVAYGFDLPAGVQGNLGGRAGADAFCRGAVPAGVQRRKIAALISVNGADEIRDLPNTAGVPRGRSLLSRDGRRIADDWNDFLDGSLDVPFCDLGRGDCYSPWTGSNPDGSVDPNATCGGWSTTDPGVQGKIGDQGAANNWLTRFDQGCDASNGLFCLAYDPDGIPCSTCPVQSVTWLEAVTYANALSTREGLEPCYRLRDCRGRPGVSCPANGAACDSGYTCGTVEFTGLECTGYRLPTEAEWELAARAGTSDANYAGGVGMVDCTLSANLDGIAWYCGNANGHIQPVGLKRANAFGLYDMIGNVFEHVFDAYAPYPAGRAVNPLVDVGARRILRGGGYGDFGQHERAAIRLGLDRGFRDARGGLRLVRSL
jgi:formylglycine-generating enzyme required for sulfatase activity